MMFQKPALFGRKRELEEIEKLIDLAANSRGNAALISGEAGIGKSRLLDEVINRVGSRFSVYSGAAAQDAYQPFGLFSDALESMVGTSLFSGEEFKTFTTVFAVNRAGLLVAQASSEIKALDGDIFAGMLTAVQSFIGDSVGSEPGKGSGLGRLEYGNLKIIIENSEHLFITAVFEGAEHPDMKKAVRHCIRSIENEHAGMLESWNGMMKTVKPIQDLISGLAQERFLVRRELEGLKLEEEHLRIADHVLESISTLAERVPVLLLLEDLHWADESSIFVFEYLARNIRGRSIMIIATSRPIVEGPLQSAVENVVGRGCTIIPLIGLEDEGLASILEETFPGQNFPTGFTDKLMGQCEGNPFFFLEMLRQIWVDGNVTEHEGRYTLIDQNIAVPSSVEGLIQKRLADLEPDVISLVEYMACIGRRFSREEAFSMHLGGDPVGSIEKLIDLGIVLSGDRAIEFSHGIYQDVIYSGISDRWKYTYHKSLGEYYESAHPDNQEVAYQLARHFFRSKEQDKAFIYCMRAGEKAENAFGAELAIGFYSDALSLVPEIRDSERRAEAEGTLAIRLGDLQTFTGRFDEALESFGKALSTESDDRKRADIYRKIAEVNLRRGEYDVCRKACESGLEILNGRACKETERLYATLGWTFIRIGKHVQALEILEKGLGIARELNDREGIASAEHNIGSVMLHKGEYLLALEHFEKALLIKEDINDVMQISSTLNNMGNCYLGLGDLVRSIEYYERSVENSRAIGDNRALSISLTNMGNILACLGNMNKAMDCYHQSHELKVKFDDKWGISTVLENIGTIHFSFGEMDKAMDYYMQSLAIRKSINDYAGISLSHINLGELYHNTDLPEKALEHCTESLRIAEETDEKWLVIVSNYHMAESMLALKRIDEALKHAHIALKISIETSSKSEEARSRQILGTIHTAEGKFDLAASEFERVREIYGETHEKGEMAKLVYDYAMLHLAKGEIDAAKRELKRAKLLFQEVSAGFFAGKCQKQLDRID